jgi:hypothetical protein
MNPKILVLAAAGLTALACNEPETPSGVVAHAVSGRLAYRNACQNGVAAPFEAQGKTGPLLYVTDEAGARVSGYAYLGEGGAFTINGVAEGEQRLHIAAGKLQHFWLGEPRASLGITVEGGDLDLGLVCADSVGITGVTVGAAWRGDVSAPLPSGTLPVWAAAQDVTYSVYATTRDGAAVLPVVWDSPAFAEGATEGVLSGRATDGYGSWTTIRQPVRYYANRAAVKNLRGWMTFGQTITAADLAIVNANPANSLTVDEDGLHAEIAEDAADASLHAALRAGFNVPAAAYGIRGAAQVPMRIEALAENASVEFGLGVAGTSLAALRVTRAAGGYELRLLGTNGAVAETIAVAVDVGAMAQMTLAFDPATRELRADFSSGDQGWTLTAVRNDWNPERLFPYVGVVRQGGRTAEATEVVFLGLSTNLETNVVSLAAAAAPGYDYGPLVFVEQRGYPSVDGVATFSIDRVVPLARVLAVNEGVGMTVFTDVSEDAVEVAYDEYRAEAVVPVSNGAAMLY